MREEMGRMEVPMEEQLPMGSTIDCTVPGLHPGLQFVEPIKKHEHTCSMEKHTAVGSSCPQTDRFSTALRGCCCHRGPKCQM